MKSCTIVFPHQLFEENPALIDGATVFLVEEFLFFRQFKFHKAKLAYHRATMKFYGEFLASKGFEVVYIEAFDDRADVRELMRFLGGEGFEEIHVCEVADDWLERRLNRDGLRVVEHDSPMFLNSTAEIERYFDGRKHYFQTDFYIAQRKKLGILLEAGMKPTGGKWSFDADNRRRYPKDKIPPLVVFPPRSRLQEEAEAYVENHFGDNYGEVFAYPANFADAHAWLADFLATRFREFGEFEDAIVARENILNHSVLTPMLNCGLLTPREVIEAALEFSRANDVPLNSLEGFLRQIIGWREFIRGVYRVAGRRERTRNFWGFTRKIPESFWSGTTGIAPLDDVVRKVLKTGYCHHIERLMVVGNFMLLCEFDPDEVYRWFMELFIDAYDWVMVTNVYGMSQFADGGLMATKPYISGSNYLMKMSDFPKGDWQTIWDALFWRFMDTHRDFFLSNPRLGMLVRTFDKMSPEKRIGHIEKAENYLASLG